MAAHEALRSPKKSRPTPGGGETRPTGKPPAGPPKTAERAVLKALAIDGSSEGGEEGLKRA